jgi:hypothetical protein
MERKSSCFDINISFTKLLKCKWCLHLLGRGC